MLSASKTLVLALLASPAATAQLSFPANQIQFSPPTAAHAASLNGTAGFRWTSSDRVPRIAIIGAGAGGSSAAYFLRHFGDLAEQRLETDVTIYDAADYIGGRSTVIWPWNQDPLADPKTGKGHADSGGFGEGNDALVAPVELGASIFVAANKNLQKARRLFGLEEDAYGGENGNMAIWDGEQFVFEEKGGGAVWDWWHKAKLLWRYGRSAFTVRSLVQKTVASFVRIYSADFVAQGAFASISNFSAATELIGAASLVASDFFTQEGVSTLFTNELTSAATQVNYGAPVTRLHGVGALVSLAATGAVSVRGGNRQIFEHFVGRSGARLRLGENARVEELLKLDAPGPETRARWVVKTASGIGGGTYDAIIFSAPFHQTGIHVVNSFAPALIPKQPYVCLYVTFVITNASTPQPSYFGLKDGTVMPNEIFGTFTTGSTRKPTFNSLNYLKELPPAIGARFGTAGNSSNAAPFHVVKMFSDRTLDAEMLDELYGPGNVAKTVEKTWLAYPKLTPVTKPDEEYAPVRPDEGLYYVNAMERLVSTMETETVAAFNAVSLLLNDFFAYTPPASWAEWPEDE